MAVPATNVFGPAVSMTDVKAAVLATLKLWLPTYVHELERRTGRDFDSVEQIRSWNETSEFQQDPGDQLPALIVVCPGLEGALERRGDGSYAAWWAVVIGVVTGAKDKRAAAGVAELYELAVRMILAHKGSLGGFAQGRRLLDVSYDDAPADFKQVAGVATVAAAFLTENIVAEGYGPDQPDDDPDPLGLVQEVDIDARATREGDPDAPDLMHLVSKRSTP